MREKPADLPALTSLRFLAAAMIFVFHLREYAPAPWVYAVAPGMYHGVSFFFVLSGFVLTHAYGGREGSWGQFYLARLARIAPVHLASLLLLLAVLPLPAACGQRVGPVDAAAAFALKALMLDAWAPVRGVLQSWNNVSWSISVEMAFYAVFPPLLAAMTRRPALTLAATAAISLGVIAAGAAAGVPVFVLDRDALTLTNLAACFPPARLFEFALGVATCLAWRRWLAPARLPVAVWTALEAGALGATAAWLVLAVPPLVEASGGPVFAWLRASGSCFLFAALISALASGRGWVGQALSQRPFVALGEASFAFYMVHMIVMRVLRVRFGDGPGVLSALTLSLALAFVMHYAVEGPMRRRVLALGARGPSPGALAQAPTA